MRSDLELLTAWRAGDVGAGDELLVRHMAALVRFFRNKVPEHASDLAQQTFLGCVESRDRIDPDRNFRAYLFGIARHRLLEYLRARRRRGDPTDVAELSIEATTGASPSRAAAEHEQQRVLLHALRAIPLDFQIAIELYYWEELPTADIAAVLGVAEGTVRSRLTRARTLLRERIEAAEIDEQLRTSTLQDLDAWARSLAKG